MYVLKFKPSIAVLQVSARIDRVYAIALLLVLATGIDGVFHTGKGLAYYLHSGAFHGAVTFYALLILLSIKPWLRVRTWNRNSIGALPADADWGSLRKWIHIRLGLVTLIVFCMSAMARGVGSA